MFDKIPDQYGKLKTLKFFCNFWDFCAFLSNFWVFWDFWAIFEFLSFLCNFWVFCVILKFFCNFWVFSAIFELFEQFFSFLSNFEVFLQFLSFFVFFKVFLLKWIFQLFTFSGLFVKTGFFFLPRVFFNIVWTYCERAYQYFNWSTWKSVFRKKSNVGKLINWKIWYYLKKTLNLWKMFLKNEKKYLKMKK